MHFTSTIALTALTSAAVGYALPSQLEDLYTRDAYADADSASFEDDLFTRDAKDSYQITITARDAAKFSEIASLLHSLTEKPKDAKGGAAAPAGGPPGVHARSEDEEYGYFSISKRDAAKFSDLAELLHALTVKPAAKKGAEGATGAGAGGAGEAAGAAGAAGGGPGAEAGAAPAPGLAARDADAFADPDAEADYDDYFGYDSLYARDAYAEEELFEDLFARDAGKYTEIASLLHGLTEKHTGEEKKEKKPTKGPAPKGPAPPGMPGLKPRSWDMYYEYDY